jgi:hypothetical protein
VHPANSRFAFLVLHACSEVIYLTLFKTLGQLKCSQLTFVSPKESKIKQCSEKNRCNAQMRYG